MHDKLILSSRQSSARHDENVFSGVVMQPVKRWQRDICHLNTRALTWVAAGAFCAGCWLLISVLVLTL